MTTSIRPARPGDEGLILSFIRELADYEKLLDEVISNEDRVRETFFGPSPRVFCDIAQADGAPAGFAVWFYNYSTFTGRGGIYLEDLFVRPQFRGRGLGKGLLVHLARRVVAEGGGRLVWQVLDWNTSSIAFYESIGARHMNDWLTYRLNGDALAELAR